MSTVRISEENKELVEGVAEQLGASIKDVIDMILKWFFSEASNIEELEVEDLDDDEEEEEEG